jgi:hypothetical protein
MSEDINRQPGISSTAERRLAGNEVVFRDVNEGIVRGQWPGEPGAPVGFRCECARLGCNTLLGLTLAEYEHVRAGARRFVMLAGHEMPELERVIERLGQYVVVEKTGEAGDEASQHDPRS